MTDQKIKTRTKSGKRAKREHVVQNRYHLNAKLSEYKFLQILRGFCNDVVAAEVAAQKNISEKTIRFTYKLIRNQLFSATMGNLNAFGGAGFFMFDRQGLSKRGHAFIEAIQESNLFADHMRRHAPRTKKPEDAREFLFEVSVRLFCNLAMNKDAETLYPQETRDALGLVKEISQWIRDASEQEQSSEQYSEVVTRFGKLITHLPLLLMNEELLALKSKAVEHRFPSTVLYDDLRRHLLKHPIQNTTPTKG